MIRRVLLASLAAASLVLAGCGKSDDAAQPGDPYAGLDREILGWRTAIEAAHPACAAKVEGKGCDSFQVMCKAEQEIDSGEAARGVTAQVIAAMSFNGRNPDGSSGKSGSAFATFSKAGDAWTREEAGPVNMSSCAPL